MEIIINSPVTPIFFSNSLLEIRYYGLIISFSIFLGLFFAYFLFNKYYSKKIANQFIDDSFCLILFSIIGARIFYVLANLNFYLANPKEILLLNHGGISIWGAITFGVLTIYFICKKNKFSFLKYCDILALVFPLCQAIGRFGNYFNQEAFGIPTNGILKLFVDVAYRPQEYKSFEYFHPAFLYESILNIVLFMFLISFFDKKKEKSGLVFFSYLIGYSLIRILVESIRIDSTFYLFNLPIAQIISLFALVIAVVFCIKIKAGD